MRTLLQRFLLCFQRYLSYFFPNPRFGLFALMGTSVISSLFVLDYAPIFSKAAVAVSVAGVEYSSEDLHDSLFLAVVSDPDNSGPAVIPNSEKDLWLNSWILFTALNLEMADREIPVTERHYDEASALLSAGRGPLVDNALPGDEVRILQGAVTAALYEWTTQQIPDVDSSVVIGQAGEELSSTRALCSNHILVATEVEAEIVLSRLLAGESFGDLAEELSLDPESSVAGGDLGCYLEGTLLESYEAAAYSADPGELVTTVTDLGIHIIEVLSVGEITSDHHPQLEPSVLASLRSTAEERIVYEVQRWIENERYLLRLDVLEDATKNYASTVSVNPRYGTWDAENFTVRTETGAN